MGQLNYNNGANISSPKVVFKTIAENMQLVEGTSVIDYDFTKLKVTSRLINAIQYFNIEGLFGYKFAYIHKDKNNMYLFTDKAHMTEAIKVLLEGRSIHNDLHLKYLMLDLSTSAKGC